MLALFLRDLRLSFKTQGAIMASMVFFLCFITIIPFAVGIENDILSIVTPGLIWIAVLLSSLLGIERLFRDDYEDGTLDIFIMHHDVLSLSYLVALKALLHWLTSLLPLILLAPICALFFNIPPNGCWALLLSLLIGTPAIVFIGALGAALTLSLPRGAVLLIIIILPLLIPVLIFGIAASIGLTHGQGGFWSPLAFSFALSLFFAVLGSFSTAIALKYLTI